MHVCTTRRHSVPIEVSGMVFGLCLGRQLSHSSDRTNVTAIQPQASSRDGCCGESGIFASFIYFVSSLIGCIIFNALRLTCNILDMFDVFNCGLEKSAAVRVLANLLSELECIAIHLAFITGFFVILIFKAFQLKRPL
jgi:hypothetical protein